MVYNVNFDALKTVHFVGVSGIGVSAVAFLTLKRGIKATGSSIEKNEIVEDLIDKGLVYMGTHKPKNVIGADLIVRSAAVMDDNPEILKARDLGIEVLFYSEYLGLLMSQKKGIAVAGTHGKTTTTSILASILTKAGLNPEVVCGGIMAEYGSNAVYGDGDYFLAEACEYNRSFLDLKKEYGIITNIEPEHLDYYQSFDELLGAFKEFMILTNQTGSIVVNGDDKNIRLLAEKVKDIDIITVGYTSGNLITIKPAKFEKGRYVFNLEPGHDAAGWFEPLKLELYIPGRHNILNASLAAVLAKRIGVSPEVLKSSIAGFKGTGRRTEIVGNYRGNTIISDYGHHPTEIRATLHALRDFYPDKPIILVFQPHQYSRTYYLFDEFVKVLSTEPDILILTDIYRQRDSNHFLELVSSEKLFRKIVEAGGKKAYLLNRIDEIWNLLESIVNNNRYIIVFMGAGNIDRYARIPF